MNRLGSSPYASPAANGIREAAWKYEPKAFDYVFDITLGASQTGSFQQGIHTDSDFAWRGLVINSTGAFSVQFSDSDWFDLSSGQLLSNVIQGDPSSPYPIFPEIIIPAGGRIGMEVTELSGAQNVIQFLFRGAKRFPVVG